MNRLIQGSSSENESDEDDEKLKKEKIGMRDTSDEFYKLLGDDDHASGQAHHQKNHKQITSHTKSFKDKSGLSLSESRDDK